MILAEDLKRLVSRRAPLVIEIVDAFLPGYQIFSLLPAHASHCDAAYRPGPRVAFVHQLEQIRRCGRICIPSLTLSLV